MKMSSSRQCIWCGDFNKPLAEGKKYCTECSRCCKQECKTCHKPYPNLKYFHPGADHCKFCSTRHEKRKMYTKNEAIALAKATKGKNKTSNDDRGEDSIDEFPPLSKVKQQNRKRQRPIIGDESDPDCRSSSCSPLTISDNESVDEIEVSGDEVHTKSDEDSEPDGSVSKKNRKVEPGTSSKPRSVYDMLKDADKKKEGQVKKNTEPIRQKKRTYKKRPVAIKTQAQAEKDLMKSLLVYKRSLSYSTHINVIFMPSSQTMNDES